MPDLNVRQDTAKTAALIARRQAAIDIFVVLIAIAAGWLVSRYWLYPWLHFPENAPLILRPTLGFVAAWIMLRMAGHSWSSLGLHNTMRPVRLIFASIGLYGVIYLVATFLVPVLAAYLSAAGGPVFLAYIRGNTLAFVGWLGIAWLVGGLIEELLFRGFLLHRIQALFAGGTLAAGLAIILQAALFGALHLHQGALGFVFAGSLGIIYGLAYYLFRRNLWPLIIVHGTWNSVAICRLYGLW